MYTEGEILGCTRETYISCKPVTSKKRHYAMMTIFMWKV